MNVNEENIHQALARLSAGQLQSLVSEVEASTQSLAVMRSTKESMVENLTKIFSILPKALRLAAAPEPSSPLSSLPPTQSSTPVPQSSSDLSSPPPSTRHSSPVPASVAHLSPPTSSAPTPPAAVAPSPLLSSSPPEPRTPPRPVRLVRPPTPSSPTLDIATVVSSELETAKRKRVHSPSVDRDEQPLVDAVDAEEEGEQDTKLEESDEMEDDPLPVQVLSPARPHVPRSARPTKPSPIALSAGALAGIATYRRDQPFRVNEKLSIALAEATFWSRTDIKASTKTRGATETTLNAFGPGGITVTHSGDGRLEKIVHDFRQRLGDRATGRLARDFEQLHRSTELFLKKENYLENELSHELYAACHLVVHEMLELDIFKAQGQWSVKTDHEWGTTFTVSGAADMVVEPHRKTPGAKRNPKRQAKASGPPEGHMSVFVTRQEGAKKRAKGEDSERQRVAVELKTTRSGSNEEYFDGLQVIKEAEARNDPVLLWAKEMPAEASAPTQSDSASRKLGKGTRVLAASEPLAEHFVHRVGQVGEYIFAPVRSNPNILPAQQVLSFNGDCFWVAFRVGPKEMAVTDLYEFDGDFRFVETLLALAWAQASGHELVYSE